MNLKDSETKTIKKYIKQELDKLSIYDLSRVYRFIQDILKK